jgi:hypothetical protein
MTHLLGAMPPPERQVGSVLEARSAPVDRASILSQCETTLLTIVACLGIDSDAGEEWLRRCHMPGDPKECREHAKRCWALASEVTNPVLRDSLLETAQRWSRLAVDLEAMHFLLEEWGPKDLSDDNSKKAG